MVSHALPAEETHDIIEVQEKQLIGTHDFDGLGRSILSGRGIIGGVGWSASSFSVQRLKAQIPY
jgi:hypothetical protein